MTVTVRGDGMKYATLFHGTTESAMRSVWAHGLRKGTYCTDDLAVAVHFANCAAEYRHSPAVILQVRGSFEPLRLDKNGRSETRLRVVTRRVSRLK